MNPGKSVRGFPFFVWPAEDKIWGLERNNVKGGLRCAFPPYELWDFLAAPALACACTGETPVPPCFNLLRYGAQFQAQWR